MTFPPWWAGPYGATPPLGYALREAFPERWLRIHSLPDSRRYPRDAADVDELLARHEAVATALLGDGPCRLLTAVYEADEVGNRRPLPGFGPRVFACIAADPEVSFWSTEERWSRDRDLLLAIADDQRRALWMHPGSGEVYAPYDGGADLLTTGLTRREALRQRFSAWLSLRPDGR